MNLFEEAMRKGAINLYNLFIYPEIERRKNAGLLDDSFVLTSAQWIQCPDGGPNEVRLNSEVKAIVRLSKKSGISKKKGDPVYENEIKGVKWIELSDQDNPNCAHATYLFINDIWHVMFDFRQNQDLARKYILSALQFLNAAEDSLEKKHWPPFLDALFSAAELAVLSIQKMTYAGKARKKTTHGEIKRRFNAWVDVGNALPNQKDALNKLSSYRARARYDEPDFSIPEIEAVDLLKTVREMIESAQSFARTTRDIQR